MNRHLKLSDIGARIICVTTARNLSRQLSQIAERATMGRVPLGYKLVSIDEVQS